MASFTLLIQCPPNAPGNLHALMFAKALKTAGHQLNRVFFSGDGVYTAFNSSITPQGEQDLGLEWQEFAVLEELDAVVCIAAALRRGLYDQSEGERFGKSGNLLRPGFTLSGLGQLVEGAVVSDRLLSFG